MASSGVMVGSRKTEPFIPMDSWLLGQLACRPPQIQHLARRRRGGGCSWRIALCASSEPREPGCVLRRALSVPDRPSQT